MTTTHLFTTHLFTTNKTSELLTDADFHSIELRKHFVQVVYKFKKHQAVAIKTILNRSNEKELSFSYNAKELKKFLAKYKGAVHFTMVDDKVIITRDDSNDFLSYNVSYSQTDGINFSIPENFYFEISKDQLLSCITTCKTVVDTKVSGNYILDNVFVTLKDNKVTFTSTDGRVVSYQTINEELYNYCHEAGFYLHKTLANSLIELFSNVEGNIIICFDTYDTVTIYSTCHTVQVYYKIQNFIEPKPVFGEVEWYDYDFDTKIFNHTIKNIIKDSKDKDIVFADLSFDNNTCKISKDNITIAEIPYSTHHSSVSKLFVNLASVYKAVKDAQSRVTRFQIDETGKANYYQIDVSTDALISISKQMIVLKE